MSNIPECPERDGWKWEETRPPRTTSSKGTGMARPRPGDEDTLVLDVQKEDEEFDDDNLDDQEEDEEEEEEDDDDFDEEEEEGDLDHEQEGEEDL